MYIIKKNKSNNTIIEKISKIKKRNLIYGKNKKQGSELTENILITSILMFLIVMVFFPRITNMFQEAVIYLNTWFQRALGVIG